MTALQHTGRTAPDRGVFDRWTLVVAAVVAGSVVGIGTQVLQGVLPDAWSVLGNSGVVWAMAAFALGTTMPSERWAAITGAVELDVASVAYYEAVAWFEGQGSDGRGIVIWSLAGVVAGVLFGIAGQVFSHRRAWRFRVLALLGGLLLGEGAYLAWLVGTPTLRPAGLVEIAAGVLLLARSASGARWSGPTWPIVATGVGAAVTTLTAITSIDLVFQRW